jgi:YD repeat-containing protein
MRYIKLYIFIITLVLGKQIYGQSIEPPKIMTPEAASFVKFIDNGVSLSNGSVDVSISVYTIKDGAIEIPISLRYNTSGIKVNEEATWVGLGWNLNVGGMITQVTKGEIDDLSSQSTWNMKTFIPKHQDGYGVVKEFEQQIPGFFSLNPSTLEKLNIPCPLGAILEFYYCRNANTILNPDIYYYNFLNYSGKFYFDPVTRKPVMLDRSSNVNIEYIPNEYFKATAPNGIMAYFTYKKYVSGENLYNGSTNYYLTKIIYPDGNFVGFEYDEVSSITQYIMSSCSYISEYNNVSDSRVPNLNVKNYAPIYLKKVVTPNFIADFTTSTTREDIPGEKKLSQIIVLDRTNGKVRSFSFRYDYFTSNLEGNYCDGATSPGNYYINDPAGFIISAKKRLKLISFGEDGLRSFIFTYNEGLPVKTSYAVDYWGYYNGEINNKTLIPNFSNLYIESAPLNYTGFANRASNPNYAKTGLLTSIKYPTGGERRIEYESNTFTPNPTGSRCPSTEQIKNVNLSNSPVTSLLDQNNASSDKRNYILYVTQPTKLKISGKFIRGSGDWASLQNAYIEVRHYSDLIYKAVIPSNISNTETIYYVDKELDLLPIKGDTYYYTIIVSLPDELGNQYGSGTNDPNNKHYSVAADIATTTTYINDYSYYYGAGMRVKRELLFNPGSTVPNLIYKYDYDQGNDKTGSSSGQLSTPLQFHKFYDGWYCIGNTQDKRQIHELYSSNQYPDNTFANGNVTYTHVIVHSEGSANWYSNSSNFNVGKTDYTFINESYNYSKMQRYLLGAPLWNQPLNGKMSDKVVFDNNNKALAAEHYFYSYEHKTWFWGLLSLNKRRSACPPAEVLSEFVGEACTYPIKDYLVKLDSVSIIKEGKLQVGTKYEYNAIGQTIKERTRNSEKEIIETTYEYPYDWKASSPFTQMVQYNQLVPYVNKIVKSNNKVINKEVNTFTNTHSVEDLKTSLPIPVYNITQTKLAPNGIDFTQFINYAYDKRLVEIKKEGDIPTVFVWGYNYCLPVAKVVGATYQQVSQAISISGIQTKTDADLRTALSSLKNITGVNVSYYTYNPLYGVTSQTDENGVTIFYEYDALGRLKLIKRDDNKVLKAFEYNYKP